MPSWSWTVDVRSAWKVGHELEVLKPKVVKIIQDSPWYRETVFIDDLKEIINEIEASQSIPELNAAWDRLYDLADEDRCWIQTF